MQQLTEIRWHARAGQGAVTAAKVVAETALSADQYMQAMPEYGPERMGAPIKAFTRISDQPIEIHNNIEFPDVVIVLDESLIDVVDVTEGIKDTGTVIINTCSPADAVKKALELPDSVKVACVDASGIALDTIKRDIPNTPIVGALIKATGVIDLDVFKGLLAKNLSKKFGQEMID
ncbi:pyruvate synthase, partial [bacterium]|nr:pyruvate synthase [bacterium]